MARSMVRISAGTCCSDVAQSRHVAQWIAEISVQSRQPADSGRQGNPAPNQTVHERQNSPTCSECVAAQVASAAAAVLE